MEINRWALGTETPKSYMMSLQEFAYEPASLSGDTWEPSLIKLTPLLSLPLIPNGKAPLTAGKKIRFKPVGSGFHFIGRLPSALRRDLGVNPEARSGWERMREAAGQAGVDLSYSYNYRSIELQAKMWERSDKTGKWVAPPGRSEHHTGLAFDIRTPGYSGRKFGNSQAYRWLTENAFRFGFVQSMSWEPWHWRYDPQAVELALNKA